MKTSDKIVEEAWNAEYQEFLAQDEFDDFAEYIFNKYPYPDNKQNNMTSEETHKK